MPSKSVATRANNVRVRDMDSEALGQYVAEQTLGILRRTEELRPLYIELWERFDKLNKGETICGCRNRTEYCEKILHRTIRSVEHVLRGSRKPSLLPKEKFTKPLDRFDQDAVSGFVPEDIHEEDSEKDEAEREAERNRKQAKKDAWDKAHPEEAAERARKAEAEQTKKKEESERRWSEFDRRHSLGSKAQPPAEHIREFANLGRRAAAQKHHPDKGGSSERMAQLNQVADWLESLAGAV